MMWSRVDGHLRAHRDAHTDVVIEHGRGHPLWLGRPAQDVFRVFELPRGQRFGGYNTVQIGEEHRLSAAKRLAGDRIPLPNPDCDCTPKRKRKRAKANPVSSYKGVSTYSTAGVHKAYLPTGIEVFDARRGGLAAMKQFIDAQASTGVRQARRANPKKPSRAQLAAVRVAEALQAGIVLHWTGARNEGTAGPYHEAVNRGKRYAVITDNTPIRPGLLSAFPSAQAAAEFLVELIGVGNTIDALKFAAARYGTSYTNLHVPIPWSRTARRRP